MDIRVETRLAASGEREPEVVWFGSRRVPVLAVVDRWYGTQQRWWKLETAEGVYVLRRDDSTAEWVLAAVTRT